MNYFTEKYIYETKKGKLDLYKQLKPLKENFHRDALLYCKNEINFLNVPYIINNDEVKIFSEIAHTTYGILQKVTLHYINNENYRALFNFSPMMNSLILSPVNYDCIIPIMRMDIFYNRNSKEFKFCEINTDGTSALKEIMDINYAFANTNVYRKINALNSLKYLNMYDSLVNSILDVYATCRNRVETPFIAIADYTENAAMSELSMIKTAFENKGLQCIIANMREFTYKEGNLYYGERKIDLVYRRASTFEIVEKIDDSKAFIENAQHGKTPFIGHFRTQVAHNKMLFSLISKPATQEILSDDEREFISKHFPFTTQMKNGNYDFNEVKYSKDRWVIKPKDDIDSDVCVGVDVSQTDWEKALEKGVAKDYLLQEYCEPFRIKNNFFDENGQFIEDEFGTMIGLYVFNGKLKGFYPRAGTKGNISKKHGGFTMGAFIEEAAQ